MGFIDQNIVPADDDGLLDAYSATLASAVDLVGPTVSRIERIGGQGGHGSGFAISPDGLIVTNNHVVDTARSVRITTPDGFVTEGRVLGRDPDTDIALIRANSGVGPWARLGDSKRLKRGHIAIAIGTLPTIMALLRRNQKGRLSALLICADPPLFIYHSPTYLIFAARALPFTQHHLPTSAGNFGFVQSTVPMALFVWTRQFARFVRDYGFFCAANPSYCEILGLYPHPRI